MFWCPMLDCRNATSVDNNKSIGIICLSEIRISRAQLRKVFNNKEVQPCIVMKTKLVGLTLEQLGIECSTIHISKA